ncbi:MAG TPA: GDSL-type esterase/lipase family protein [Chitinophagaceae bacterium]|jgi:lysophospholipase L1-like esterase|nr:GDSL-type esterase/lipase family protein [Chitinophagaceae bacterium]
MIKKIFCICLVIGAMIAINAQPFANEIAAFKKQDSISFPPKQAILFVGSSSFRLWKDLQQDFPGHTIINRGFGGSTLPDVIRYENDIIFPYEPRQVVIYCGENDLAASDTVMSKHVFYRFKQLFEDIRKKFPKVSIVFISIKPSPSRIRLDREVQLSNYAIQNFLKKKKRTVFIDVYHPMLKEDGTPMSDIFLEDDLHMNRKGYAIWQKLIEPHLLK